MIIPTRKIKTFSFGNGKSSYACADFFRNALGSNGALTCIERYGGFVCVVNFNVAVFYAFGFSAQTYERTRVFSREYRIFDIIDFAVSDRSFARGEANVFNAVDTDIVRNGCVFAHAVFDSSERQGESCFFAAFLISEHLGFVRSAFEQVVAEFISCDKLSGRGFAVSVYVAPEFYRAVVFRRCRNEHGNVRSTYKGSTLFVECGSREYGTAVIGILRPVCGQRHVYRVDLSVFKLVIAVTRLSGNAVCSGRNVITVVGKFKTSVDACIIYRVQIGIHCTHGERIAYQFACAGKRPTHKFANRRAYYSVLRNGKICFVYGCAVSILNGIDYLARLRVEINVMQIRPACVERKNARFRIRNVDCVSVYFLRTFGIVIPTGERKTVHFRIASDTRRGKV